MYRLSYEMRGEAAFTRGHLEAFGQTNGVYNAWPFWREYVYSTLARMGLRPITLPVFRLPGESSNPDEPAGG